jgi:hypothetical protein
MPIALIEKNIILQPKSATRYDVIGAPTTEERGIATRPSDRALALSFGGSHLLIDRDIAGK